MSQKASTDKRHRTFIDYLIWIIVNLLILGLLLVFVPSTMVKIRTLGMIEKDEKLLTSDETYGAIVVFGAGLNAQGGPSPMLEDRLLQAKTLYDAGLSDTIVLTGDHTPPYYNEPLAMKTFLIEQGVPESAIVEDGQGYSTFDSVKNLYLKTVPVEGPYLLVTQRYHLYRALYIANRLGLEVKGSPSSLRRYPGQTWYSFREVLARDKDLILVETYLRHPDKAPTDITFNWQPDYVNP